MDQFKKEDIDLIITGICQKLGGKICMVDNPESKPRYIARGHNIFDLEQQMLYQLTKDIPIGANLKVLQIYSFGVEKTFDDFEELGDHYKLYIRAEWV